MTDIWFISVTTEVYLQSHDPDPLYSGRAKPGNWNEKLKQVFANCCGVDLVDEEKPDLISAVRL